MILQPVLKVRNQMENSKSKLKITLKPFDLPHDRHYVKVRNNVLKFQTNFRTVDGAALIRFVMKRLFLKLTGCSVTI